MKIPANKKIIGDALKNLSLLAAGCLVAFIAAEFGLRLFVPDKGGELINISFSKGFVKKDDRLGLAGVQFAKGICYNCETRVSYNLNSEGFRDGGHLIEKDADKYRIMVLGDSFTWGVGVAQDKIFTRLLEEKNERLEVINASVPGWSTTSEFFYLRDRGLSYKPDMVMVVFCVENDAFSNGNYERDGFPSYVNPTLTESKNYRFLSLKYVQDHSRIFRLWKRMRRDLKIKWGLTPILTEYTEDSLDWMATKKWIDKFKETADGNHISLVFVTAPSENQFALNRDADRPQRMLGKYLEDKKIDYVNLYPIFFKSKKTRGGDWGYFKYDGHWDELGHRIVAQSLYDFIHDLTSARSDI